MDWCDSKIVYKNASAEDYKLHFVSHEGRIASLFVLVISNISSNEGQGEVIVGERWPKPTHFKLGVVRLDTTPEDCRRYLEVLLRLGDVITGNVHK